MRVAGRPFGVLALIAVATLGGLWAVAAGVGIRPLSDYAVGGLTLAPEVARGVALAWGAMLILAAVLLAVPHPWGWTLLMLSTGLGLFGSLWQWWSGNLEPVRLLLLVVTAFYLNAREVRELVLHEPARPPTVPLAPPEGGGR